MQNSYPLWLVANGGQFADGQNQNHPDSANSTPPTNSVLYLSAGLTTVKKPGGSILGGSTQKVVRFSINELSLTATNNSATSSTTGSSSSENQSGNTAAVSNPNLPAQMTADRTQPQAVGRGIFVHVVSVKHDPVQIPLSYSASNSQISFEASWRPDGHAALVVVPKDRQTSTGREDEFGDTGAGEILLTEWQQPQSK